MTKRSRKSRNAKPTGKSRRPDQRVKSLSDMFTQQRLTVGGMTAFAVAFSYVSANALWYQPHEHSGAFFATRSAPELVLSDNGVDGEATASTTTNEPGELDTVIRLEQEQPIPPRRPLAQEGLAAAPSLPASTDDVPALSERSMPASDEEHIRSVQTMLADLNLYDDEIDGLNGPNTRQAIERYQQMVGLAVTGTIDEGLLEELGLSDRTAKEGGDDGNELAAVTQENERQVAQLQAAPSPRTDSIETTTSPAQPDGMERRIRAGLKAFGNDGISADGPMDERTRSAIVEFQSLFGLETDGQPSTEVYAKMQEIGLIN